MPLVVFRADGGPAIGAGHVMRCLALAAAFEDAGWSIGFAASADTFQSVRALGASRYEKLRLPEVENAEAAAMSQHWPAGADVLVVDHYGRGAEFERACRPWAKRIVVIDDLADRAHDADLLVDAGRQAEAYRRLVPAQCTVLTGPRYALVHPQFLKLRQQSLARRDGRDVKRILLSFGQMDAPNATLCAFEAIESLRFEGEIDIAIGSAAPNLDAVKKRAGGRVHLHVDADNMAELMMAADLAVGAGGGTAWERCCLGLPTVLVEIADNQRGIIALVLAARAGLDASVVDGGLSARIRDHLRDLLQDGDRRTMVAECGARLVDGRGASRLLFYAVGKLPSRDGLPVELRAAESDVAAWLLELQRKPETRRHFRDPAIPGAAEHYAWVDRTLADPDRILLIVEFGGERAGFLRLDRIQTTERRPTYEISVAVDPRFQGKGIGGASLSLARRCFPGSLFEATVLPANKASASLFKAAGYILVSDNLYRSFPS